MWSQVEILKSHIREGNDTAAETSYQKLLTSFSAQPTLATEICRAADTYLSKARTDKAAELYQYVLDHWPGNEQLLWAEAGKAKLYIVLGDEAAAKNAIDNLIAKYNDHPDLLKTIINFGAHYWNQAFFEEANGSQAKAKDYFRKAINEYKRIITQLPESPQTTAQAYLMSGFCYHQLGEFENAVENFREVVDNWPEYERADRAWFRMAQCLNELANSRRIPKEDAAVLIKYACQRVLTDYPDSVMVHVSLRLKEYWASIANKGESK
jgi:tetratricopeptide (TPR) repeat protein